MHNFPIEPGNSPINRKPWKPILRLVLTALCVLGATASWANPGANLTTDGTADWIHWGYGGLPGIDHKANGGSQISSYSVVGSGSVTAFTDGVLPIDWTDGTPAISATGVRTGARISGTGNGFRIVAPSSTTNRTFKLYCGGTDCAATFRGHLSDQDPSQDVIANVPAFSGTIYQVFTVTPYHSGSSGQTLTVTWTMTSGTGNVAIFGASLAGGDSVTAGPSAPAGLTATPGNSQVSLLWLASSGATSYNVYHSTTSGGPYTPVGTTTGTTFTDTGLSSGTVYYYVVTAVNTHGEGAASAQASATPTAPAGGSSVVDFNGDGKSDLILQKIGGNQTALWYMNGTSLSSGAYISAARPAGWKAVGVGDFNADSKPDLVLQNTTTRQVALWYLNGATVTGGAYVSATPPAGWRIAAIGDFNSNGKPDLVLQNSSTGQVAFWYLNGPTLVSGGYLSATPPAGWSVVGAADFNGDGKTDLALQNAANRQVAIWYLNGATVNGGGYLSAIPPAGWNVAGFEDFNNDGHPDLIIQNASTGQIAIWYLNGLTLSTGSYVTPTPVSGWKVVGAP